jgi:replicative DNA helicase
MGKVAPSNRYKGNRTNEIGEVSQALTEVARKHNVPVVALAQLNRQNEQRSNKRGTLADIRDSGNIEQDADVVMTVFRPAYYLERLLEEENSSDEAQRRADLERDKNKFELQISKQRNGPRTDVKLFCDMASNAFRNAAKPQQTSQLRAVS